MNPAWAVQRLTASLGFTLKRSEFPEDNPINVVGLLVESLVARVNEFMVVSIGANDGVTEDPIAPLIRRFHLRALLVEPIPEVFLRLAGNYRGYANVACENCAIAHTGGTATLYRVKPDPSLPPYVSQLASFDRAVIMKQRRVVPKISRFIESIEVPSLSFEGLLHKHSIHRVDLLQIDTEGFDYEILKMVWQTSIRPSIIHFESHHLRHSDKVSCAAMLRSAGYRYLSVGRDTIAYMGQSGAE